MKVRFIDGIRFKLMGSVPMCLFSRAYSASQKFEYNLIFLSFRVSDQIKRFSE